MKLRCAFCGRRADKWTEHGPLCSDCAFAARENEERFGESKRPKLGAMEEALKKAGWPKEKK
jgi:predicted amidophosphoribosyltransferase